MVTEEKLQLKVEEKESLQKLLGQVKKQSQDTEETLKLELENRRQEIQNLKDQLEREKEQLNAQLQVSKW